MFKILIVINGSVHSAKLFRQVNSSPETVKLTEAVFYELFHQSIQQSVEVRETFMFVGPDLSKDDCIRRMKNGKFSCKFVKERILDKSNTGAITSFFQRKPSLDDYARVETSQFSIYFTKKDELFGRLSRKINNINKQDRFLLEASELITELCDSIDEIEKEIPRRRKQSLGVTIEGYNEIMEMEAYKRKIRESKITNVKLIDYDDLPEPITCEEQKHDRGPDGKSFHVMTVDEILSEAHDIIENCTRKSIEHLKSVHKRHNIPYKEIFMMSYYKTVIAGVGMDLIKSIKVLTTKTVNLVDLYRESFRRKYILWLNGDRPEWNYFQSTCFRPYVGPHADIDYDDEIHDYDINIY